MSVKLLTENHLEFLSLKGGCTGLSESTLIKVPHCWKSHAMAHMFRFLISQQKYIVDTHWKCLVETLEWEPER